MNAVTIFCDGSSLGNPGPGGWGAVVTRTVSGKEKHVTELGGFAVHTTNNRMELTAATEALAHLSEKTVVTVKTDSQYVIQGITKWVFGWERNGWQTSQKSEVLNKDLWEALVGAAKQHTVTWEHVRAHVGVVLNERVDQIAYGFAGKEKVQLFVGSETAHHEFLKSMPKARVVSKSKSKSASSPKKSGPAYSYVSVVEGEVLIHKTWAECEKRVKGKSAKYKKAFSKEDEQTLRTLWGKE